MWKYTEITSWNFSGNTAGMKFFRTWSGKTPQEITMFKDKVILITGENICIDGGQTRLMICHGDHGRTLNP